MCDGQCFKCGCCGNVVDMPPFKKRRTDSVDSNKTEVKKEELNKGDKN